MAFPSASIPCLSCNLEVRSVGLAILGSLPPSVLPPSHTWKSILGMDLGTVIKVLKQHEEDRTWDEVSGNLDCLPGFVINICDRWDEIRDVTAF